MQGADEDIISKTGKVKLNRLLKEKIPEMGKQFEATHSTKHKIDTQRHDQEKISSCLYQNIRNHVRRN